MNDNQFRGRIEKAMGAFKQVAGKVVGNKKLARKGKAQLSTGTVQANVGDMTAHIEKSLADGVPEEKGKSR